MASTSYKVLHVVPPGRFQQEPTQATNICCIYCTEDPPRLNIGFSSVHAELHRHLSSCSTSFQWCYADASPQYRRAPPRFDRASPLHRAHSLRADTGVQGDGSSKLVTTRRLFSSIPYRPFGRYPPPPPAPSIPPSSLHVVERVVVVPSTLPTIPSS